MTLVCAKMVPLWMATPVKTRDCNALSDVSDDAKAEHTTPTGSALLVDAAMTWLAPHATVVLLRV